MIKIDLYFDTPVNLLGECGTSYPNVVHISTIDEGDEYVEDENGEILYLREMDNLMRTNACGIVEQRADRKKDQIHALMEKGDIDWATAVLC